MRKKEDPAEDEKRRKEVRDLQDLIHGSEMRDCMSTEYLADPKFILEEAKRAGAARMHDDGKLMWISAIDMDDTKWDPMYISKDLRPHEIEARKLRFKRGTKDIPKTGESMQIMLSWTQFHVIIGAFTAAEALMIWAVFIRMWATQGYVQAQSYMRALIQRARTDIMDGKTISVGRVLRELDERQKQEQVTKTLQIKIERLQRDVHAKGEGKGKRSEKPILRRPEPPFQGSVAETERGYGTDRRVPSGEFKGMKIVPVRLTERQSRADGSSFLCLNHDPRNGWICQGYLDQSCPNDHKDTRIPKEREAFEKVQNIARKNKAERDRQESKRKNDREDRGPKPGRRP